MKQHILSENGLCHAPNILLHNREKPRGVCFSYCHFSNTCCWIIAKVKHFCQANAYVLSECDSIQLILMVHGEARSHFHLLCCLESVTTKQPATSSEHQSQILHRPVPSAAPSLKTHMFSHIRTEHFWHQMCSFSTPSNSLTLQTSARCPINLTQF
jgi:hypothetical protein